MQGMPDILPVGLQDFLHGSESELREEIIVFRLIESNI